MHAGENPSLWKLNQDNSSVLVFELRIIISQLTFYFLFYPVVGYIASLFSVSLEGFMFFLVTPHWNCTYTLPFSLLLNKKSPSSTGLRIEPGTLTYIAADVLP
jgi:hypothetical protein